MKKLLLIMILVISNPLFAEAAHKATHGGHGLHGETLSKFIASIVSFIIFATIIFKFGRKPLKDMLVDRKNTIETEVNKSKLEKEKTEQKLLLIENKMAGLDNEISLFKEKANKALINRQKNIVKTREESILNLNENLERQEIATIENVKLHLQKDMTQKAIKVAEEKIKEILLKDKMAEVKLLKQFKIN